MNLSNVFVMLFALVNVFLGQKEDLCGVVRGLCLGFCFWSAFALNLAGQVKTKILNLRVFRMLVFMGACVRLPPEGEGETKGRRAIWFK